MKQPWTSATGRRIAYFSSMCRDKSMADDDKTVKSNTTIPWVQKLQDDGIISRDKVNIRNTALRLTAPFHQSCRSHVGIDYKFLYHILV